MPGGILADHSAARLDATAHEETDDLAHHLFRILYELGLRALRVRRRMQARLVIGLAPAVQGWRVSVRAEESAQELAHDCDGTDVEHHECRELRRLVYAAADPHSGQRRYAPRQFQRQHDRPLALVISRGRRTLAGQEPDVIQHRLPVESLARIHSRLPGGADGAVAQQRSEEHTSELQSPDTISYAVFCL